MEYEYEEVTVWTVVKRFLIGWAIGLGILVLYSCVKYKEFVLKAFGNNMMAWFGAALPVLIVVIGICSILKSFKK